MEKGFILPGGQYIQVIDAAERLDDEGNVLRPEITVSNYPDGTLEVPLRPSAFYEWDHESGAWLSVVVPPDAADVDAERDRRILRGMTANLGAGLTIPVLGRAIDKENLQGIAFTAQLLIADGAGATITKYRDANNIIHDLTQPQVLDLWQQAASYLSLCFQSAWTLKDDPSGIPDDFADDTYWP